MGITHYLFIYKQAIATIATIVLIFLTQLLGAGLFADGSFDGEPGVAFFCGF
jgi:hypothetical protein